MPYRYSHTDTYWASGPLRAARLRVALGVAVFGLALTLGTPAALAQGAIPSGGDPNANPWSGLTNFFRSFVPQKSDELNRDLNYSERPPLVVPRTRDLPPPATAPAADADWPRQPAKNSKSAKAKDAVVPDTSVQTPNPPLEKKPWYNPAGWFDKEEYAVFKGEPVRENLTDPPAGYRVPSPDQPYGIGPDKDKPKKAAAGSDPAQPK
jgi:hypothetical protein